MKIFQLIVKVLRKIKFLMLIPFWEIQAIVLDLFLASIKIVDNAEEKKLLIIKLDAIGDYVVFRNFLEQTRKSKKFRNHKIYLLGNIRYKDLALKLDSEFVDEFIWIDPSRLLNKSWILSSSNYKLISKLKKIDFEFVINPAFTRQFLIDRLIVKNVFSPSKIGFVGDNTNAPGFLNRFADRFYTKLIAVNKDQVFEFYRNRTFFEKVLSEKILLDRPTICMDSGSPTAGRNDKDAESITKNKKYIIIFPGAGTSDRQWSPLNFAVIIDYIEENHLRAFSFIVMGGKADTSASEEIMRHIKSKNVTNMTGQTNLVELTDVLSGASLLICNDTGAAHIAAALGTKTIFLLKGNGEFGRFGPYPPEISEKIYAIFPPKIGYSKKSYDVLLGKRFFTTEINDIKPDLVKRMIDKVL